MSAKNLTTSDGQVKLSRVHDSFCQFKPQTTWFWLRRTICAALQSS